MKQRLRICAALGLSLGLSYGDARADSMRCGNRLVADGDSLYQVRSVCGDPDDAQRRVEYRTIRDRVQHPCPGEAAKKLCERFVERTVEVTIDEWTYDFGKNRFLSHLTFEQGKLLRITTGGRGHKD